MKFSLEVFSQSTLQASHNSPYTKSKRVVLFSHCQNLVPSESEDVNDFSQIQGGFYPRELILSGIPCNQCSDGFRASISEQVNNAQHFSPPHWTHVFESEVEVEGRRSPSLPRDPNARTVAWCVQGVVYIEWTVSVCSKRVTPIALPPFNHGSVEMALLKMNSLSWKHT